MDTALAIGLASNWVFAAVMFAAMALTGSLWNVITVSLRQTIIPDQLLGRVNSVYRFFGWGMMPIGLGIGGLIVWVAESAGVDRIMALRLPWFLASAALLVLFIWAAPKLTTEKIESARSEGIAAKSVPLSAAPSWLAMLARPPSKEDRSSPKPVPLSAAPSWLADSPCPPSREDRGTAE